MYKHFGFFIIALLAIGCIVVPSQAKILCPRPIKSADILVPLPSSPQGEEPVRPKAAIISPPRSSRPGIKTASKSASPTPSDLVGSPTAIMGVSKKKHLKTVTAIAGKQQEKAVPASDIPLTLNKRVEWFLQHFQTKGKNSFRSWLEKSGEYIPMIQGILRHYGLPEDLAYLALIESGFNLRAYSRCHAVGLWQFLKGTAKRYDLTIDWWVDERRDPEKSTRAAARYLSDLYKEFGSWYLAMAGYNAGAGRIRWAIRKAGTKNFWYLADKRLLKRETRDYVPKMIAATLIAKEPERYGFGDVEYLPPLCFDKVTCQDPLGLKVMASLADTTVKEILLLNPELRRRRTPPGVSYTLRLPSGKGDLFLERLARIETQTTIACAAHKSDQKETLSGSTHHCNSTSTPTEDLARVPLDHKIKAGNSLIKQVIGKVSLARSAIAYGKIGETPIHIVRKGDTLWEIAKVYNIDLAELRRCNNLTDDEAIIRPGETLLLTGTPGELSTF